MQHPINGTVRLASPMARVFYRIFGRSNPLAWAQYHIVKQPGDKLWIHTHGLRRRAGFELEFMGVPANLRQDAIELMFVLAGQARANRPIEAGADFEIDFPGAWPGFRQTGTFREARHSDPAHGNTLRIVDSGQRLAIDYPCRLFAAHLTATAERTASTSQKAALFAKSLKIFRGDFADESAGADFDPENPDITELQNKSNLGAYIGMAHVLRDAKRFTDAFEFLLGAIARCPGWARVYRDYLLRSFDAADPYLRYWSDIDISRIRLDHQPAAQSGRPAMFGNRTGSP